MTEALIGAYTASAVAILTTIGGIIVNIIRANKTEAIAKGAQSTADTAQSTADSNHAETMHNVGRLDAHNDAVGVALVNAVHNSLPIASLDTATVRALRPIDASEVTVDVEPH